MKNFLMPLIALGIALVSCQKESPTSSSSPKPAEQIAYIDETGEEALTQIEPKDFQVLADMITDITKDSLKLELDQKSQTALLMKVLGMLDLKNKKLVIDTDDINGTLTINGTTASYTSGSDMKIVFKSGSNTYTAKIQMTKGSKQVKLGAYEIEDNDIDIYLIVPSAVKTDIYNNNTLYMGGDFKINATSMPSDWTSLTFSKVNASISGTAFINGKGSYSTDITNLSANAGNVQFNGSVCGNKGAFLSNGTFSAFFKENEESGLEVDMSTIKFSGNLINKIESRSNTGSVADIYFAGDSSVQLSVDMATEKVTFADGTSSSLDALVNKTNFPKTYASAKPKIEQFITMFGIDDAD